MNIQEFDIMNKLFEKKYKNQRELAKETGYSVGKVNGSLKDLQEQSYIDREMRPTEIAKEEARRKKTENAIILAAGYGMRMVPINVETPKGLLEIHGEALIERLILQLHEAGIKDIDVVVGFMKEQYEYLIDKYDVNLIYNKDYPTKNNLHSLKCAEEKIHNTYIIPCDIWCKNNPFFEREWYSWYMITDQESEESTVRLNRKQELVRVKKGEVGNEMIGIAYITRDDAVCFRKLLREYSECKEYNHTFWETVLFDSGNLQIGARMVKAGEVVEINTYEELRELDHDSDQLHSDIIKIITEALLCDEKEIGNIKALKKGMTNRSFEFSCRGKRYIMRVPGEGTNEMINRRHEYDVYMKLSDKKITDPVIYISPENGYKITEYVEGARNCDSESQEDVRRCMQRLREFHDLNIKVEHKFDLYEQIEYYESLWGGERSAYRDYEQTKQKIYELKSYIDHQEKQIALTHIDAVCDNFLMAGDRIYLIDWEYAGMQDVHVDIAMFAIYAMYDRKEIDQLIHFYFHGKEEVKVKLKIYCYIAVCGLLWSNWCEYKRICGVEFGEYSLKQYRYAKEFYRIVQSEMREEGLKNV